MRTRLAFRLLFPVVLQERLYCKSSECQLLQYSMFFPAQKHVFCLVATDEY